MQIFASWTVHSYDNLKKIFLALKVQDLDQFTGKTVY